MRFIYEEFSERDVKKLQKECESNDCRMIMYSSLGMFSSGPGCESVYSVGV